MIARGGSQLASKVTTCKICGWHGHSIRHKPEHRTANVEIKKLCVPGLSSREVAPDLGIHVKTVLNALKIMGGKAPPRGETMTLTAFIADFSRVSRCHP